MKVYRGTSLRRFLNTTAAALAIGLPVSAARAQDDDANPATQPAQAGVAAQAQTDDDESNVVVTATRRSALLDEIPASLSVVSGDTLQRDNITNIVDLNGRLPSVLIGQSFGGARVSIRGVGFNPIRPGDEGRVAYYTDGVYIARPSAQIGTLFDVERMEVLRGAQGTLYGRNATGGALLVVTRDPTNELSGYLNVTGGSYDLLQVQGALSGPLGQGISARVAFEKTNRGGYWDNAQTGNDVGDADALSLRGTLLIQPTSNFRLRITADHHSQNDRNYVVHPIRPGFVVDTLSLNVGQRDVSQPFDPSNEVKSWGLSATAAFDLSQQLTLTGIFGYRNLDTDLLVHGSGHRGSYSNFQDHSDQIAMELQLTGNHGPVEWIVGGSYFFEDQQPSLRSVIIGRLFFGGAPNILVQGTNSTANLVTDAYAVFGEATWHITDALSVTGGIRYSWETKQALREYASLDLFTPWPDPASTDNGFTLRPPRPGFPRNSQVSFDSWTPRLSVNYEFTPDLSAYATYVEGFKSGGFNYGTIQAPYLPETIQNYEVGLRARAFNRALTLRAAAFHYAYSALQQTVQLPNIVGTFVLNTGDATIQGVELEFVAQIGNGFQIDGNVALLDSEFDTFLVVDPNRNNVTEDIAGNRVPQAPKYTLYLGAQYAFDLGSGSLTLRGDYRRTGSTEFDVFNNAPMRQGSYDVVGASLTFESSNEHWRASIWGQNLGNTYAVNSQALQANALGGGVAGNLIPPRTFGMTVGYNF